MKHFIVFIALITGVGFVTKKAEALVLCIPALQSRPIEEATKRVEDILPQIINGTATTAALKEAVEFAEAHGIITIKVSDSLTKVKVPVGAAMERYGSTQKPVNAHRISGSSGSRQPGAVLIHAGKESVDLANCLKENGKSMIGPLHTHAPDGYHISMVAEGSGTFFIVKQTSEGRRVVAVPAEKGSVMLFRGNEIHTFHTGNGIEILHSNTRTVDTDQADYLSFPSEDLSKLPAISYVEYLKILPK